MKNITCQRLRLFFWHMCSRLRFGRVGWPSYAIAPLRVIGGSFVEIGDKVTILDGARIEAVATWGEHKYSPSVKIGTGTSIGQHLHLTCAQQVAIGEDCAILPQVLITDINHSYLDINISPMQAVLEVHSVSIGNGTLIGMGARILPGVHLGKHCVVGANAVVRAGRYPDYSVLVGVPARVVKQYDVVTGEWKRSGR